MPTVLDWPEYLLHRAAQPPPPDCSVIPGSTAVVSFGHPLKPEVATLGINPSSGEFLDRDGSLLGGARRRLATLESLGLSGYKDLTLHTAAEVVDDCAHYFGRRPYGWFQPLDTILSEALSVSYYTGTACHLDLVQWATEPLWGALPDVTRSRLLSEGRSFLVQQLRREGYRLVIVNGRTAMSWVQQAGLVRWNTVQRLGGDPPATFHIGVTNAARFLGWSCNIQSQPGARRHMPHLIKLARQYVDGLSVGAASLEATDVFPKGTHFRTRGELVSGLEDWLARSDSPTIGDAARFGRAPWISFESSAGIVDLNADTSREAIERAVDSVRSDPSARWYVVPNRRGRINKVIFGGDDSATGWYAYVREPLSEPATI